MFIMTQSEQRIVNEEYVSQFYIDEQNSAVMAIVDGEDVALGLFADTEQARSVLNFIGQSLVDKNAQNKITQIPTLEFVAEAAEAAELAKKDLKADELFEALKELVKNS